MKQNWLNWRQILLDDPDLTFGEKAMGLFLNTYMNDNNDFAFPSIATICGRMNVSNVTAIKHIQGLSEKGYLIKQKRYGNTTIYYSNVPKERISCEESSLLQNLNHSCEESSLTVVKNLHTNNQKNKQSNNQGEFGAFWKLYPIKKNKLKAEKAFNRLSKEKQAEAINDIKTRYKETDRDFIPHPTTYINGERWNDETEAKQTNTDLVGAI